MDASILNAAVELLANNGSDGLSINAVARRSGVARASIYLRYPSTHALMAATLRAAIGREPIVVSGDLESDLRQAAIQAQAILANPSFREVLPEVVRGLLRQPDGTDGINFDLVAPALRPLGDEYQREAAQSGFRADIAPDLPGVLIVGGLLLSLLVDGIPASPEEAEQVVEVVLAGLRAPTAAPV